ncbi:MAG: NUDIX domain-containing protein, partial [Xanthomonadaceae bacterium]|nr:NUDIX domain-containing protein [Xanthomonadaceae bacterium]
IKKLVHPEVVDPCGRILERLAARGIVLRDARILLLFTERYNDFSFPGGGVDPGEDLVAGLRRELAEETGARDVRVLDNYGYIEELRPHWRPEHDLVHMTSHFFVCEIALELQEARLEHYERDNGMRPVWVGLDEALSHNRDILRRGDASMGQSIQRETFMLQKVADDLDAGTLGPSIESRLGCA